MINNSVTVNRAVPGGVPGSAINSAFNNALAKAYASGDPRANLKPLDRAGFSRGAGQMNQAGINAADEMASGLAQAYQGALDLQAYNANSGLQGQSSREQYAQALGGLNAQESYAAQMAALQRQQAGVGMLNSLLGGLLS
jgi:hypothetical protein